MSSRLFKHQMAMNNRVPPTPHMLTAKGDLYSIDKKTDAFTKLVNFSYPSTISANGAANLDVTPDGKYIAVATNVANSTDGLAVYKRTKDGYVRLTLPTGHSTAICVCWSADGQYLFSANYTDVRWWRRNANDTFTLMPALPTQPTEPWAVAVSKNGKHVGVAHNSGTFLTVYKVDMAAGTSVKLAAPSAPPADRAEEILFLDNAILYVTPNTTGNYLYEINETTDVVSKVTHSGISTNYCYSLAASPDGRYVAMGYVWGLMYLRYDKDTRTFTKLADSVGGAGQGRGVNFSKDGKYLVVTHGDAPYLKVYRRDGDALTLLTVPASIATAAVQDAIFIMTDSY